MPKQRVAISLSREGVDLLDQLNQQRFGGAFRGRSAIIEWALEIAARVLKNPATLSAQSGVEALDLYLASRGGPPDQPVPPALARLLQRVDSALKDLSTYPDTHIMDAVESARQDIASSLAEYLLGR